MDILSRLKRTKFAQVRGNYFPCHSIITFGISRRGGIEGIASGAEDSIITFREGIPSGCCVGAQEGGVNATRHGIIPKHGGTRTG